MSDMVCSGKHCGVVVIRAAEGTKKRKGAVVLCERCHKRLVGDKFKPNSGFSFNDIFGGIK